MQQYYEALVTLRGSHARRARKTKNLNRVDILSIQE
jgi:hypothetical protein